MMSILMQTNHRTASTFLTPHHFVALNSSNKHLDYALDLYINGNKALAIVQRNTKFLHIVTKSHNTL
jgi:hypothetical protein